MIIDKEFKTLIPSLSIEERNLLKESIKQEGVREPLIIWNNTLIDGHNRYQICNKYNIDYRTKQINFKDRQEALLWIINNQLARRNLSSYDRTVLALRHEEIISPGQGKRIDLVPNGTKLRTSKKVSEIAKVGEGTLQRVKFIEQHANPEQKKRLSTQQDSINKVYHEIRKDLVLNQKIKTIKLPKEEFNIIYADPPWRYDFSQTNERSIETHYSSMSLEQIKEMKIPTEENSVLLLWGTAPKLKEALEVMESWGFEYKTCAIWDKEIIGMGYWFRGQHELLLIGTKGNVKTPKPENRFSSVIKERRSKHSKKPKKVYDMIESMFPNQKYLELFARNKRKNWVSWGNETKIKSYASAGKFVQ